MSNAFTQCILVIILETRINSGEKIFIQPNMVMKQSRILDQKYETFCQMPAKSQPPQKKLRRALRNGTQKTGYM